MAKMSKVPVNPKLKFLKSTRRRLVT